MTNPLDVVNTRIKGGLLPASSSSSSTSQGVLAGAAIVLRAGGPSALFAGLVPRVLITGLGSSLFFFLFENAKTAYDLISGIT